VADAGGEVLVAHGVGNHDKVVCESSGELFGSKEAGVGQGSLERPERRAMDGMNDDGDAGLAGSYSTEEAGFAAMGMEDVRFLVFQVPYELQQGPGILPGVDGADE
jgi:hypothetical protein